MRITASIDDQRFLLEDGPMINGPSYCIKTVKDMFTVVKPESLDCFLQDLRQLFELQFKNNVIMDEFKWVDDGKNDMNVNYKCVGTDEEKEVLLELMKNESFKMMISGDY